jgi:hypothetical protein
VSGAGGLGGDFGGGAQPGEGGRERAPGERRNGLTA